MSNGNPFQPDRMYTVKELAQTLGVTPRTVERHTKDGKLPPAVRLSALGPRYPGQHLQAWYNQQVR